MACRNKSNDTAQWAGFLSTYSSWWLCLLVSLHYFYIPSTLKNTTVRNLTNTWELFTLNILHKHRWWSWTSTACSQKSTKSFLFVAVKFSSAFRDWYYPPWYRGQSQDVWVHRKPNHRLTELLLLSCVSVNKTLSTCLQPKWALISKLSVITPVWSPGSEKHSTSFFSFCNKH